MKKEYVYQTEFKTREQAQLGIFDYIEVWYNKERIHSYLNGDSPVEFELKYWSQLVANDKGAKPLSSVRDLGYTPP